MSDEDWEGWEEWLQHPLTLKYLKALAGMAKAGRDEFTMSVWLRESTEITPHLVDLRARSMALEDLSTLDRNTLTNLMEQT
jgi:hypothetical protein